MFGYPYKERLQPEFRNATIPFSKSILSILGQVLDQIFDLGDIHLQVLVLLELCLHRHDVLGVSNLTVVHCFEILLKLIELCPEFLALRLDAV